MRHRVQDLLVGVIRMTELSWEPTEADVKRSKIESKIADLIEDDSLHVIDELSGLDVSEKDAKAQRRARGDLRLDTSPAEQAAINQQVEIITWVLVGLTALAAVVGLLMSSLPSLIFG